MIKLSFRSRVRELWGRLLIWWNTETRLRLSKSEQAIILEAMRVDAMSYRGRAEWYQQRLPSIRSDLRPAYRELVNHNLENAERVEARMKRLKKEFGG